MRGGTENVYGIVGLAKALEIAYRDMDEHARYIRSLKARMIEGLRAAIPGVDFHGDSANLDRSLYTVLNYQGVDTSEPQELTRDDVPTTSLIPAYMLSELKTAFLMGFRVYLPFLVIDMVIASLLISMSMMMLPPAMISLPFKILLFVLVDGWALIAQGLVTSFR